MSKLKPPTKDDARKLVEDVVRLHSRANVMDVERESMMERATERVLATMQRWWKAGMATRHKREVTERRQAGTFPPHVIRWINRTVYDAANNHNVISLQIANPAARKDPPVADARRDFALAVLDNVVYRGSEQGRPLNGRVYALIDDVPKEAVTNYTNCSINEVARMLHAHHTTVMHWIEDDMQEVQHGH